MESVRKRMNGEFHLPEPIIQHIQSFMTGKEAAQTSILSKPWHAAWSTRPNLDFDDNYKQPQTSFHNTLQRYQDLNLNIQSLRLRMHCHSRYKTSFARELIVEAMRMGAVDLDFKLQRVLFALPQQVLVSETLTRLSVANCEIYPGPGPELNLLSSRLKSLIFRSVYTQADIMWAIISNCPSIENLQLSGCKCVFPSQGTRTRMLALKPDKPNNRHRFHNLKSLLLEKVVIGTWIFDDFSSRFPCLKVLSLHNCFGYGEIKIHSRTIERMSFTQARTLRATFDVPNVRKFKFSGSCMPSLSFQTTTAHWESDVSIACERNRNCLNSSWFSKLNKLLTDLSPSVISLSLATKINLEKSSGNCHVNKEGALKRPAVENLTLSMEASAGVCTDLLDGLFSSCRPELITLIWFPFGGKASYMDFGNVICKFLPQYDLKDVRYGFEEKTCFQLRFLANEA